MRRKLSVWVVNAVALKKITQHERENCGERAVESTTIPYDTIHHTHPIRRRNKRNRQGQKVLLCNKRTKGSANKIWYYHDCCQLAIPTKTVENKSFILQTTLNDPPPRQQGRAARSILLVHKQQNVSTTVVSGLAALVGVHSGHPPWRVFLSSSRDIVGQYYCDGSNDHHDDDDDTPKNAHDKDGCSSTCCCSKKTNRRQL